LPLWVRAASKTQPGLTHEPLGGPGVVVVEVGDDSLEQVCGDGADRAELVDGGWGEDGARDAVTQFPQLVDDFSVRTGTGCRYLMLRRTRGRSLEHSSSDHAAISVLLQRATSEWLGFSREAPAWDEHQAPARP
jgi:hypothetical protein